MAYDNAFPDHVELFGPLEPDPPRRRGRRRAAVAGALVAVLGASGATYAFNAQLSGGGTQPEDVLAAGAFAFAKIDLDPAPDQKIALYQLSKKLPDLFHDPGDQDGVKDSVLTRLLETQDKFSYDADVRPWLGDRAGVAYYPPLPGGKDPRVAMAVQVIDTGGVHAMLMASEPRVRWTFRDGYLVFSTTEDEAEALTAWDGVDSFGADATYSADLARLDGEQIAVAWADMARACAAAALRAGADEAARRILAAAAGGKRWGVVAGLHATPQYLEVQAQGVGAWGWRAPQPGTDLAGRMPADSFVTLSAAGLDGLGERAWEQIWSALMSTPDAAAIEAAVREHDLRLPADVAALFGEESAVGVGIDALGYGAVTVRTKGGDKVRGTQLMQTFVRETDLAYDAEADTTVDGFVLGTDRDLVRGSRGAATPLADDPAYRLAVPDAADAIAALFVNLRRIEEASALTPAEKKHLAGLAAFGLTASPGGGLRARLTVR